MLWQKNGQPSLVLGRWQDLTAVWSARPGVGMERALERFSAPGRAGMVVAEGVHVSADDEQKGQVARHRLAVPSGILEVVYGAYQGNADAWEALWLADEAIGAVGEQELAELNAAEPQLRAFRE